MGYILSKLRKAPDSPATQLEAINKELCEIESFRKHNQQLQKKIVASLVIYSILIYLVAAILFFVYYFPVLDTLHKLLYCLPLLVFPAIVVSIKKFLHWYFVKRITDNDLKLAELKDKKNRIIEDIMENETYKKATELLQKYAPNRLHKLNESRDETFASPSPARGGYVTASAAASPYSELRHRPGTATGIQLSQSSTPAVRGSSTPAIRGSSTPALMAGKTPSGMTAAQTPGSKMTMQQRTMYGVAPGPPLPRQVLPRERSYVDKLFEYLVGDGPQNRYALICYVCHSHNGMALPEEFDYLSFRCCYCFTVNLARKQRPNAPRLNLDTTIGSSSASELEDGEEVDNDDSSASEAESPAGTSMATPLQAPVATAALPVSAEDDSAEIQVDKKSN